MKKKNNNRKNCTPIFYPDGVAAKILLKIKNAAKRGGYVK